VAVSVGYTDPENVTRGPTKASDVYSLGVVALELIAGLQVCVSSLWLQAWCLLLVTSGLPPSFSVVLALPGPVCRSLPLGSVAVVSGQ
jgi:serine/threonine protein kinase